MNANIEDTIRKLNRERDAEIEESHEELRRERHELEVERSRVDIDDEPPGKSMEEYDREITEKLRREHPELFTGDVETAAGTGDDEPKEELAGIHHV